MKKAFLLLLIILLVPGCTTAQWMQIICAGKAEGWSGWLAQKTLCRGVQAGGEVATGIAEYQGAKDKAEGLAALSSCPEGKKYFVAGRCLDDQEFAAYYQIVSAAKGHGCAKDQYWIKDSCSDYSKLKDHLSSANIGVPEGKQEAAPPANTPKCDSQKCRDSCAGNIIMQRSCRNDECVGTGRTDCSAVGSIVRCVDIGGTAVCKGECRFDSDCPNKGKAWCEGNNVAKNYCTADYRCEKRIDDCVEFFGNGYICRVDKCVKG